ncbi:MAG: hypothetical protein GY895_12425 [Phycisphaera sp.]|nr:hypothetical protein [Phycisphaera sp.]
MNHPASQLRRQGPSKLPLAILGAAMASRLASAAPDDGVHFLGADRSDEVRIGHIAKSNDSNALFQWNDVTSMIRRHHLASRGESNAAAIQDGYVDQRGASISFDTSVSAGPFEAFARSNLSYDFEVLPLSDRDCTSSYGAADSVLEEAFAMVTESSGYAGPPTSARIDFFYDVRYEDLDALEPETGPVVEFSRGGHPVLESDLGGDDNDWYVQHLEPGSYSIDVDAEILARRTMRRGSVREGACEVELSFEILDGPGRADSTLVEVSRSALARSRGNATSMDESSSLAGGALAAAKSSAGSHADATEEVDGTNNAFWGRHRANSRANLWSTGEGAVIGNATSEIVFEIPGSSSYFDTDVTIVFDGFLAIQGIGDGAVTIEVWDDQGHQYLEQRFDPAVTISFGGGASRQSWSRDLSLSGGEYTFRITSETSIPSFEGLGLADPSSKIDCSFAVILD